MLPRGPRGGILKNINQFLNLFKTHFMARQKNLFNFTGKLGDLVFYSYKGNHYVRSAPVRKNKTLTAAQAATHKKFALAGNFVQCLYPLLTESIPNPKKMSRSNYVMSHIIKHAITGDYPNFSINYSAVFISSGTLQPAWSENALAKSGNVIFSWKDTSTHNAGSEDDKAILVVYCEALNKCIYLISEARRGDEEATLEVPKFHGHEVHTWLAFTSDDGKLISGSTYTGALFVT
jgi:hypothetical protein